MSLRDFSSSWYPASHFAASGDFFASSQVCGSFLNTKFGTSSDMAANMSFNLCAALSSKRPSGSLMKLYSCWTVFDPVGAGSSGGGSSGNVLLGGVSQWSSWIRCCCSARSSLSHSAPSQASATAVANHDWHGTLSSQAFLVGVQIQADRCGCWGWSRLSGWLLFGMLICSARSSSLSYLERSGAMVIVLGVDSREGRAEVKGKVGELMWDGLRD